MAERMTAAVFRRILGKIKRRVRRALRLPSPAPPAPPPRPEPKPGWEHQPDWRTLLAADWPTWEAAVRAARDGPRILVATSTGAYHIGTNLETTLAVALTLRGARVHLLLCDQFLPACNQAMIHNLPVGEFVADGLGRTCRSCFPAADEAYQAVGLPLHHYSELVTGEEARAAHQLAVTVPRERLVSYRWQGIAVAEHALAGALRYYARGSLEATPEAEAVLRRYFEAALLTAYALQRLLARRPFAAACFNHGIYVPHGQIGDVARGRGVRVVNWNPAYRKQCFIFSHGDTYHHTLLSEPTSNWEDLPWTPAMEADILDYLKSRWQGTRDWIWFHEKPDEDFDRFVGELGLDPARPIIGMLTNVMWDAQLHYPANAFPSMLDWVLGTIRYFVARPDLQLLIRVHPAEVRGTIPSCQPLSAEIRAAFPQLPANVFVVEPESQVSTYAAMLRCDSVLIYGTKTGVELTSLGIPVIVAGEAWIRNKGITLDAQTAEQYYELLDRLPMRQPMSEAATQRARRYAYHFFFRRMIPLEMMAPHRGAHFKVSVNGLDNLRPGASLGLDVICDGILTGSEFIYPAERYPREVAT